MPKPTRRAIILLALGLPVALLPVVFDKGLWVIWIAFDAAVVALLGLDALLAPRRSAVRVSVDVPKTFFLGEEQAATVSVETPGHRGGAHVGIHLDLEGPAHPADDQTATVRNSRARAEIPLRPKRRGMVDVRRAWVRWSGPLGLMERVSVFDRDDQVAVVPNIRAVRRAALRFQHHDTFIAGVKTRRFIGDGSEFESLRKYVPGLDHRQIDWKASARHRKLLCRENRAERNHRIVLAFDTGRLMSEPLDGIPKLDHAINAGLMLAYLSLRIGDQVGLFAFDEEVRAYQAPQPGVSTFHHLTQQSAALDYASAETNYTLALTNLSRRLRRRSIVIVLTDFTDTVAAELMIENLSYLARRHLVVFVSLRDPALDAVEDSQPSSILEMNRSVVASEMIHERDKVIKDLRRRGIFCIDSRPRNISADLLNRYLDIHRRELL